MPRYEACGVALSLAAMPLAGVISPEIVLRKGDVAKARAEGIEKKLRDNKTRLREERVRFPGDEEGFGLNWLGDAPFMQVKVESRDGGSQKKNTVADGRRSSASSKPKRAQSGNTDTIPKALVLHINLSGRTFMTGFSEAPKTHLKIEVFFNGQLASCSLVHIRDIVAGAKSMHQIFAGTRNDFLVERPWIIWPSQKVSNAIIDEDKYSHSASILKRWREISEALLLEANKRGVDDKGERPPSADFLKSLALMTVPRQVLDMQTARGKKFGVIDVVITAGRGKKVTSGTSYLTEPQRLKDERYRRKVGWEVVDELNHTTIEETHQKGEAISDTTGITERYPLMLPATKGLAPPSSPWGPFVSTRLPSTSTTFPIPSFNSPTSSGATSVSHGDVRPNPTSAIMEGNGPAASPVLPHGNYISPSVLHGNQTPQMIHKQRLAPYNYGFSDPVLRHGMFNSPIGHTPPSGRGTMSSPMGRTIVKGENVAQTNSISPETKQEAASNNGSLNTSPYATFTSPTGLSGGELPSPFKFNPLTPNNHPNHPPRIPLHGEFKHQNSSAFVPKRSFPPEPPKWIPPNRSPFSRPSLSSSRGLLPPRGLFSVTQKPKASISAYKKDATIDNDAPRPSILVSRLTIAGKDGSNLVDHRWPVAQRVAVNSSNRVSRSLSPRKVNRYESPGSAEYVEASAGGSEKGVARTRATTPPVTFPKSKVDIDVALSPVRAHREDLHSASNGVTMQQTYQSLKMFPSLSSFQNLGPNATSENGLAENTHSTLANHPGNAVPPSMVQHKTPIAAGSQLHETKTPAPGSELAGISSVTLPSNQLLEVQTQSSPLAQKSAPKSSLHFLDTASSSPLSSIPPSPTSEERASLGTTANMQRPKSASEILAIPQMDGTSDEHTSIDPKLQQSQHTPHHPLPPSNRRKRKLGPTDESPPTNVQRSKRGRSLARLKVTTNPRLNEDCVIEYAMEDNIDGNAQNSKKRAQGLLRQIKGERQGVFTEEYVLLATRFFVAGS